MIRVNLSRWLSRLVIASTFFTCPAVDHILTFWIKPYPLLTSQPSSFKINPFMAPHALAAMIETSEVWPTAGLVALYGGYIAISDISGQITFPLMQQKPNFLFIITRSIRPVFMLGNTIHHWELVAGAPTRCFTINQQQDPTTQFYFWEVTESSLPPHLIIPLNAVIIFINPESVMVPLGITITYDHAQFILPPLYLINHPDTVTPALTALGIKSFFSPIANKYKKQQENYYARQLSLQPKAK